MDNHVSFGNIVFGLASAQHSTGFVGCAEFLDKNPLEESLDREVVVEDNADIPLAEIAACCIYTSSLLAFLPNWNDMWRHLPLYCYDTEYVTGKVFKHCKETYSKLIPSRKEMMNIRSFRNNNSSLKFEIKAKQFYAASQRVL